MKLTKSQLKRIIKEELTKVMEGNFEAEYNNQIADDEAIEKFNDNVTWGP